MTEGREAVSVEISPPKEAEDGRSLHQLFREPERLACALAAAVVAAEMERHPGPLLAPNVQGLHEIEAGDGLYCLMKDGFASQPVIDDYLEPRLA